MDNPFYCPFMGELPESDLKERRETCKKENCYFFDRMQQKCLIPVIGIASVEFVEDLVARREEREILNLKNSSNVLSYEDKQEQTNVLLSLAERHIKNSNISGAITEYRKILILDAENSKAHFELGKIYSSQNRHSEAMSEFKEVLFVSPDNGHACLLLIESYKKLYEDYSEKEITYANLIKKFMTVVETNPYDSNAYFAYGCALNILHSQIHDEDLKQRELAISALKKAVELNPQNIYAYWGLKDVYNREFFNGRIEYDHIIMACKQAVAINDKNPRAYFELAEVYFKKPEGDMEDAAIQNYEKALVYEPNNWEIHFRLGEIFQKRCEYSQAIEKYSRALSIAPKSYEIHYKLGNIYFLNDFYDKAIAELNLALTSNGEYFEAFILLGKIFSAKNMRDEAINAFESAIKINETSCEVYEYLIKEYGEKLALQKPANAHAISEKLIERFKSKT
ncbi:MAG TPA: tetratricopeptide repeat protein, partial [Candidatus Wallbacteria bacterium]|nr:tetratricopeptide repeat protein [Candidatus Wallbacteria bacterium]